LDEMRGERRKRLTGTIDTDGIPVCYHYMVQGPDE